MTTLTDSQLIGTINFHLKAAKALREHGQFAKAKQALNAADKLIAIADKRVK